MRPGQVKPSRPAGSSRRFGVVVAVVVALIAIIALTAVIATLTAPDADNSSDNTPSATAPTITDQQARDIATAVTRSMYAVSPATADDQVATFKANACGEFATKTLPDLITSTDQLKARDASSNLTIDSMAVAPRAQPSPQAEIIVAFSWNQGDISEKTRAVYQVAIEAGKPCITTAQFL
jgi:hypothetical protein